MTKIEGLDALAELEELYLSHNGLTRIEGLRKLVRPPLSVSLRHCLGPRRSAYASCSR